MLATYSNKLIFNIRKKDKFYTDIFNFKNITDKNILIKLEQEKSHRVKLMIMTNVSNCLLIPSSKDHVIKYMNINKDFYREKLKPKMISFGFKYNIQRLIFTQSLYLQYKITNCIKIFSLFQITITKTLTSLQLF